MSSKRGRKRNDNLPPNRARDVQRAFRARRAAHLQALEQRVTELEEENSALRAAMNLPPASRPSLGKGPTGKDRANALEGSSRSYHSSGSRDSSADLDSPTSTRMNSVSPSALRASSSAHPTGNSDAWDQPLLLSEQQGESQGGSSSFPVSTSMSQKIANQYSFSDPMPPNSRNGMASPMYMGSQQPHYSPTSDRSMPSTYTSSGYITRDGREEQQHYTYPPPPFPNHNASMQSHSPTTTTSSHSQISHSQSRDSMPTHISISYPQRRSNPEQHAYHVRVPPSPVLPDAPPTHRTHSGYGDLDGRSMP